MLFLGVVLAISAFSSFVPETVFNVIFGDQTRELINIEGAVISGNVANTQQARSLFENNVQVLWVTFIFSFLFWFV